ncbi:zinc transporter foi isoform X2 [Anthonomus grandis grandis]|uniref:zinc transporter foi isoform X2 n=1 Tax=Anthonomus grandis grandis TaxID=2921223 RepID=UPI002164F7B7|nr:zinc transporter foi isoform X2 [Anthonomus grandis grandis]
MAHHLISVSIFCLICATHSPCASHAAIGHVQQHRYDGFKDPNIPKIENNPELSVREKHVAKAPHAGYPDNDLELTTPENEDVALNVSKRSVESNLTSTDLYVKKIFSQFGDGEKMTIEGFGELLKKVDLHLLAAKLGLHNEEEEHGHGEEENSCFNNDTFLQETTSTTETLNHTQFSKICPFIVYSLVAEKCLSNDTEPLVIYSDNTSKWLYSTLAVLLISVCGVLSLVIIPLMQKRFYKPLIQFLVALAVGTLAGDALLHLLPHAMSNGVHSHTHEDPDPHLTNTWKGLVAMMGLTFFFIMERLILVVGKWRKKRQKHKTVPHAHVKVYDVKGERRNSTQCMDKYNTSPYCYKDIMTDPSSNKPEPQLRKSLEKMETNQNHHVPEGDLTSTPCIEAKMLPPDHEDFTIIIREHESDHHGHSHKHGHVHSAPQNYSSVAWMVIMGDGLHNFTDGMAIGAAFASGIAGGFSTTVAVFCHELPHELGDFAMLLKAGMSIKQALFYNLLSSALCILGNLVGLYLGNTETANQWVFAAAAGTFIYIALVDMIPELSSAHDDEDNLTQCFLHLSGLLIGVGVMTLIALYEHDLKHLFHEPE